MIKPVFISEALRMFKRRINYEKKGFKRYPGNHIDICKQIVRDCYNKEKEYFQTSVGNFPEYYSRDFGIYVQSLKELGYAKEINKTLRYALRIFEKNNGVQSTISPSDKPFDFPKFAPDAFAYTLHSLVVSENKELILDYKDFLESEAEKYFEKVIDEKTGLVKKKHFGSMKDHAIRKSSAYDNTMAAWTSISLDRLNLKNPLRNINIKKNMKESLWTGEYFLDDLSGNKMISGDANVFPFWTGVFTDKKMIKSAINSIRRKKLDKPFPLKYNFEKPKFSLYDLANKNYEFRNIWPMMGYPFIEMVSKIDKELAKSYLKKYSQIIEAYGTFLEVYTPKGKPFKTPFYISDEGMIWASMHVMLCKKLF